MYLSSRKPRRRDSPWRVLVLVLLIIGGLYVLREQFVGADWTRPFDATPTPTRSAESYFEEGEVLYQEGVLDSAIAAYEHAFRVDPQDNIALFRLARVMVMRHRAQDVLQLYGQRLQDPDLGDARTLTVLGMALDWHAAGNSEDLLPVYLELGIIEDEEIQDEDWFYDREAVARQIVRAAQKTCEQALRQDPDLPEAYACLAEALADRQRFDEAQTAAETAVELNPNLVDTQRALAYVYEVQGDYEQAAQAYDLAIKVHPQLGFLYLALGRNLRAIGYNLRLAGDWEGATSYFDQAVAAFEQAIKLDPTDPVSYDEIGWTYGFHMGDEREVKLRAIDYLEEALSQDPDYTLAHRHLGQVYYQLQNWEEAIVALERGLELGDLSPADAILSHIMLGWSYYAVDLDNKDVESTCVHALPHFQAAWDLLEQLSQRELGFEQLARQGLDACK